MEEEARSVEGKLERGEQREVSIEPQHEALGGTGFVDFSLARLLEASRIIAEQHGDEGLEGGL